jgi:uncharacterized protein
MREAGDTPDSLREAGIAWPASLITDQCSGCGACCAAPDISSLQKPLAVACVYLQADCRCAVYSARPSVCAAYNVDWVCGQVAPLLTLDERVARFLQIYGLDAPQPPLHPPSWPDKLPAHLVVD